MTRGTWGGSANAGFFAFGGGIIRDSGPTAWDILPSLLDVVDAHRPDETATIIERILSVCDELNRDAIRIASDETKSAKERGIALLALDPRFIEVPSPEMACILGKPSTTAPFLIRVAKPAEFGESGDHG